MEDFGQRQPLQVDVPEAQHPVPDADGLVKREHEIHERIARWTLRSSDFEREPPGTVCEGPADSHALDHEIGREQRRE
jgi:hypothetical protein